MSAKTGIEWTDATWNPIRGCSRVSEGCRNCYAERVAARFMAPGQTYDGFARRVGSEPRWTGKVGVVPNVLTRPLIWKKPRRIFVNSMSDLFHEQLSDETIDHVFAVMALCPHHTFQILTKRPERMRDYMAGEWIWRAIDIIHYSMGGDGSDLAEAAKNRLAHAPWLDNIWLGVSVEDQPTADARIPLLLETLTAKRFISAEPLLGPIDLASTLGGTLWIGGQRGCDGSHRGDGTSDCPRVPHHHHDERCKRGLDWVIVGGESGPDARPMHPRWARSIRDQCQAAGVPFFFKQWGEWSPHTADIEGPDGIKTTPRGGLNWQAEAPGSIVGMFRVGKKVAGRALDGRTWDEVPTCAS